MRQVIFYFVVVAIWSASLTPVFATPVSTSDTIPKITVTPPEINFGKIAIGKTKQLSLLISNTSTSALTLNVIADSVRPAPFGVDSGGGKFSLDSGKSRKLYLSFKPFQIGQALDSVVIQSNSDSAHKRIVIYLLGNGYIPDTIARINVTPTIVDFGTVYTNQIYQKSFNIVNVTNTNIKLSGTVLATHIPFSMPSGLGNFLIDSGKSKPITVQFAPLDTGTFHDSVIVTSNTDNSTKRIVVYLRGVVKSNDARKPQISIRSFTMDFGQIEAGSSLDEQLSFSIKNVSDSLRTLTVNLLFPRSPFSVSGTNDHFQLAQFESQDVTVHFSTNVTGKYYDSIIVISDAPQSRIPVYLKAEVLTPAKVTMNLPGNTSASVYPNPSSKILNVELESSSASTVTCSLFDVTGKQVLTSVQRIVTQGRNNISIDVSALPAGRYEGRIMGAAAPVTFSVIVAK
jgi:hypothetical protein